MSVIEASTARCKTMADGTLQLTVQIEPRDAVAAFTLFGAPGVPMALARLATDIEKKSQESPKKPLGGPLSQWLAIRCGEKRFQEFIGADNEEQAAAAVRVLLEIESRAEIDNDDAVRARFDAQIRGPWAKYCAATT